MSATSPPHDWLHRLTEVPAYNDVPVLPMTPVMDDKDTKKSRSGKSSCRFHAPVTLGPMTCCQSSNVALMNKASLCMVSTKATIDFKLTYSQV